MRRSYRSWRPPCRSNAVGDLKRTWTREDRLPARPLGVNLSDDHPGGAADAHVLHRALVQNGLEHVVFESDRDLRRQPGYRSLVDYRIERRDGPAWTILPRPSRPTDRASLQTGERTRGVPRPDEIHVVATIVEDPAGAAFTEMRLPVDVAFGNPAERNPAASGILISRGRPTPAVHELVTLMTRGCFVPDRPTAGVESELDAYNDWAIRTAIEAIGSRRAAVEVMTELAVRHAMTGQLRNGEAVRIEARQHADRLDVTVESAVPAG